LEYIMLSAGQEGISRAKSLKPLNVGSLLLLLPLELKLKLKLLHWSGLILLSLFVPLYPLAASPWQIQSDIKTGMAAYPSVLDPEREMSLGLDADVPVANAQMVGIPLDLSLQGSYQTAQVEWVLDFGYTYISGFAADQRMADLVYKRRRAYSGVILSFDSMRVQPKLHLGLEYRLVEFASISSGHYISSLLPTAGADIVLYRDWSLAGRIAFAANSEFGHFTGGNRKPMTMSEVNGAVIEVQAIYALSEQADLYAGLEHEQFNVALANMSTYEDFGFRVAPAQMTSRNYQLSTSIFQLGIRRRW